MFILNLKLSFNLYLNSKVSFFLLNIFNKFIFLFKYFLSYFNSINKIKIFLYIIFLIYGLFFAYLFSKIYSNYLLELNDYQVKSLEIKLTNLKSSRGLHTKRPFFFQLSSVLFFFSFFFLLLKSTFYFYLPK